MDKDLAKVLKALKAEGYEIRITKSQHAVVYLNGKRITNFGGTPSDRRSFKNSLAPLKALGFEWPPRR